MSTDDAKQSTPRLVPLSLGGTKLSIRTDASEQYVARLEKYVNEKLSDVHQQGQMLSTHHALALTVLSIADDYFSAIEDRAKLEQDMEGRLKGIVTRIDAALGDEDS